MEVIIESEVREAEALEAVHQYIIDDEAVITASFQHVALILAYPDHLALVTQKDINRAGYNVGSLRAVRDLSEVKATVALNCVYDRTCTSLT